MMAAKSDPVSSPDFLGAPRRGKGVRRLNRLPLMIVGGLILLAVAGMSYTMWQRQLATQRTAAETEPPPIQDMATSPIQRPGGPDYVEPPVPPPFPGPLDMPRERSDSPVAIQTQTQTQTQITGKDRDWTLPDYSPRTARTAGTATPQPQPQPPCSI